MRNAYKKVFSKNNNKLNRENTRALLARLIVSCDEWVESSFVAAGKQALRGYFHLIN